MRGDQQGHGYHGHDHSGIIGRSKLERLPEASSARITPRMPRKLWKAMVP